MLSAAAQPIPPAVRGDCDVDPLQQGIGVEARSPENDDIEDVVGDPGRPIPHVLLHLQPDANGAGDEAE